MLALTKPACTGHSNLSPRFWSVGKADARNRTVKVGFVRIADLGADCSERPFLARYQFGYSLSMRPKHTL